MNRLPHLLAFAAVVLLTGCSTVERLANIEPWVKPYERENIADPIMGFNRDPVSQSYIDHVYESREASRGGMGSAGGGCGCN
jgi:Domain of unknown function (DUF4266)